MNENKKVLATPKIRKFARELGADLTKIVGSERKGRIIEEDVKKYIKKNISQDDFLEKNEDKALQEYNHNDFGEIEVKEIPRIKKIASVHLIKSWTSIPHVTHHDEIDITELENFRKSLKDSYSGEKIKITPLAFIMIALTKALKDYPNFNSSLDIKNNKVVYKKYFHVGVAVDTPHGLMVPKIRNVEKKGIIDLVKELKLISEACKNLKAKKKDFYGGSMTISSLGSIGGSFFTPIINYPEVAILGVGKAEIKQIFNNDKFQKRIILPISLSYDHRIIDGAEGARFCNHLKESLGKDFAYNLAI